MDAPEARGRPESARLPGPEPEDAFWVDIFRSLSSSERMSTLERTLTCLTAGSAGAGADEADSPKLISAAASSEEGPVAGTGSGRGSAAVATGGAARDAGSASGTGKDDSLEATPGVAVRSTAC